MIKKGAPFYSMFAVGDYTFAPYKVVWPWISIGVRAAVVSSIYKKPILPEHNTSFIPFELKEEAYFTCALLNSSIGDFSIRTFSSGGGGGIASPNILKYIYIPKFSFNNKLYIHIAELSKKAHEQAKIGEEKMLKKIEDEIDELAAKIWGLTKGELIEIKFSLEELK
jgi:hypothetical protein